MAKISLAEAQQIAHLARLDLSEAELAEQQADLCKILDYVAQLSEVEVAGVEPFTHAGGQSPWREDEVRTSLTAAAATAPAAQNDGECFIVPAVLG